VRLGQHSGALQPRSLAAGAATGQQTKVLLVDNETVVRIYYNIYN